MSEDEVVVVQFVPKAGTKVVSFGPLRAVDLDERRGMGVRREPGTYRTGPGGEGPEAA